MALTNPQSGLSLHNLCEIFRAIVSSPDRKPYRVACVIDALDECETASMTKIMAFLSSLISPSSTTTTTTTNPPANTASWFKLALTSRHTHPIADLFRTLPPTHLLPLAAHTTHTARDISTFIRFRCARVQAITGCSTPVRRAVERRLAARCGTTFLWLHLVLDLLERSTDATPAAFDAALRAAPDRLDGLYERILRRSAEPAALLRVLGVLAASRRGMTLEEVDLALAVRVGDAEAEQVRGRRQFDVERRLYAVCGPLIRVVNGVVGFVHQTAVEFLVRAPGEEVPRPLGVGGEYYRYKGCLDVVGINRCLAEICVVYLTLSDSGGVEDDLTTIGMDVDEEGVDGSDDCGQELTETDMTQSGSIAGLFDYAAKHWGVHCRLGNVSSPSADGQTDAALLAKFTALCDTSTPLFHAWFPLYWPP